jgi:hypothetical protein
MSRDDTTDPKDDADDAIDPAFARAIAELPREIQPPRDLWPGIAGRIAPKRWWARPGVSLAAAAVAIAIGSSALTAVWMDRAPVAPVAVAADDWERDLDEASAELRAALASQRDELDPATLAVVDENLRIIDRAIEDTRRALASDPDDEALRRSLVAVSEQRITLLRRALALPRGT